MSSLKRFQPWLPALGYMALIVFLSSQPLPHLPIEDFPLKDKGVHFVEYGTLAVLNAYALLRTLRKPTPLRVALISIAMTTGFGYLDEVHQAFVPGRTSDVEDLIADFIGSIAGSAIYLAGRAIARARRSA